jgi:hypothetical protein
VAADEPPPVAHTKHGDLDLNQIAEQLPGMARLMVEVSDRFWLLYYAAKGGNWDLARHELNETRKTFRMAAIVRPKYGESLEAFDQEHLAALQNAIAAKDFAQFERVYHDGVDIANELHVSLGYSYISWHLPGEPPRHLRLTPH